MTALFLESQVSTDGDYLILLALLQFMVGFVQLLGAIIRTIAALITRKHLKRMLIYWGMVIFYFTVLYLFIYLHWDALFWLPFAWIIAIWYGVKVVFVHYQTPSNTTQTPIINS